MNHLSEIETRSVFTLAGFKVARIHALRNKYSPSNIENPWWLVETDFGNIEIGTRKRVISVDWTSTGLKFIATQDEVTKDVFCFHAYSNSKLLEYLETLARKLKEPPHENQTNGYEHVAGCICP